MRCPAVEIGAGGVRVGVRSVECQSITPCSSWSSRLSVRTMNSLGHWYRALDAIHSTAHVVPGLRNRSNACIALFVQILLLVCGRGRSRTTSRELLQTCDDRSLSFRAPGVFRFRRVVQLEVQGPGNTWSRDALQQVPRVLPCLGFGGCAFVSVCRLVALG